MSEQIKELIEKQITEAALISGRMIEAHKQGHMGTWGQAIDGFCERVLEIIQNQQHRIDEIFEAYEDVCRRNDSLMDTVRKLKEEKGKK